MDAPLGPLLQALEELWFLYLDAWRERGRYPIGYCFLGGRHVNASHHIYGSDVRLCVLIGAFTSNILSTAGARGGI